MTAAQAHRIAAQIAELFRTHSFRVFSAFVREGAVRDWLQRELELDDGEFTALLVDLDHRQSELLPERIEDVAPKTKKQLRALFEFMLVKLRKCGERQLFGKIAGTAADEGAVEAADASEWKAEDELPPYDLPEGWRLKLPIPPERMELKKTSPTRFDMYMKCPFTAYLKEKSVLGDHRFDDTARELAGWEFGNLIHGALEQWAAAAIAGGAAANGDAAAIAEDLKGRVDAWLGERFGSEVPSVVARQGEEAKRRLENFAAVQARREAEGWRMVAAEERMEMSVGHTVFAGKCDRIDFNGWLGRWCVIDYKTWATAEALPESIQLPCYCEMLLGRRDDPRFAAVTRDSVTAAYCVIGRTEDQVKFTGDFSGADAEAAMEEIRRQLVRYEAGIFWPPGKVGPGRRAEWESDFGDWVGPDPRDTVDRDWIADQERRISG